jgi:hypothetical protein
MSTNTQTNRIHLVKMITDDGGEKYENPTWHFVQHIGDSPRTLCGGEVFGEGEGRAEYEEKWVDRGGINCKQCLQIIKRIKAIRL